MAKPNFPAVAVDFAIVVATAVFVVLAPPLPSEPSSVVLFLAVALVFLNQFSVDQRFGYFTLTAIGIIATALTASIPQACVIGVVAFLGNLRHKRQGLNAASLLRPAFGAAIHSWFVAVHMTSIWQYAIPVIIAVTLHNVLSTGAVVAIGLRGSLPSIVHQILSRGFIKAYGYFALSGLLLANVLRPTVDGMLLGLVVVAFSVVLAETLDERRVREALETERAEHQRHAATVRVVDGLLHNLRNRLALLRYAVEDLNVAHNSAERRDAVGKIRQAVDEAASSIGDVEDGLRTSSGAHPSPTDLGDLVGTVAASYQAMARAKSIRLKTDIRTEGLTAMADAPMIRDVVSNLIKNAIEASPGHGEVKVTVTRGKDRVVISVADDGPGIPADLKDRLFEPHFTTKSQGTGLGLFTSYGIIREHRGRLFYQPNPKGGAIFTVEVPFGKEQLEPQPRPFGAAGLTDQSASV